MLVDRRFPPPSPLLFLQIRSKTDGTPRKGAALQTAAATREMCSGIKAVGKKAWDGLYSRRFHERRGGGGGGRGTTDSRRNPAQKPLEKLHRRLLRLQPTSRGGLLPRRAPRGAGASRRASRQAAERRGAEGRAAGPSRGRRRPPARSNGPRGLHINRPAGPPLTREGGAAGRHLSPQGGFEK